MIYKKQLFFALIFFTPTLQPNPTKRIALMAVEECVLNLVKQRANLIHKKYQLYQDILSLCAEVGTNSDLIKKQFASEQFQLLEQLDKLKEKKTPSTAELEQRINVEQKLNASLQNLNTQEKTVNDLRIQQILTLFYEAQQTDNEIENLDTAQKTFNEKNN